MEMRRLCWRRPVKQKRKMRAGESEPQEVDEAVEAT